MPRDARHGPADVVHPPHPAGRGAPARPSSTTGCPRIGIVWRAHRHGLGDPEASGDADRVGGPDWADANTQWEVAAAPRCGGSRRTRPAPRADTPSAWLTPVRRLRTNSAEPVMAAVTRAGSRVIRVGRGCRRTAPYPLNDQREQQHEAQPATTEMIVSMTDQVLIVWPTSMPKYSFTSQNPASFTWLKNSEPAPIASTSSAVCDVGHVRGQRGHQTGRRDRGHRRRARRQPDHHSDQPARAAAPGSTSPRRSPGSSGRHPRRSASA